MNVTVLEMRLLLEELGDDYSQRSDQELALLENVTCNLVVFSLEKKFSLQGLKD